MLIIAKNIYQLLSYKEKKKAAMLFFMVITMAIFDVAGVASIMPFMSVIANPNLVEENFFLATIYNHFNFDRMVDFLSFLGFGLFILLLTSLIFKAVTTYVQIKFVLMMEYSIGRRLIGIYLNQPYFWHLTRSSTKLGGDILVEVGVVINQGLMQLVILIAQSSVAILMLAMLVAISPRVAITVFIVLAPIYAVIMLLLGKFISKIGSERLSASQKMYSAVNEAFGSLKEVKLGGLERVFEKRFAVPAKIYASNMSSAAAAAQLPRFALEIIAFGGLLLMVLYLIRGNGNIVSALPVISLYAFAGYRLMPALQQIYSSVSLLRFVGPALKQLHEELFLFENSTYLNSNSNILECENNITLDNIKFSYPNAGRRAIDGINMIIESRTTVGFVGATGSGKTTAIDLIMGLLDSESGTISVDGVIINADNKKSWQACIAYVPQQIYLIDDTVAANIAFGVPFEEVDMDAVKYAAQMSNIHDFVVNELEYGYETKVGERGIRLSGGQRQRIGIARALYKKPKLLVFDEATSALDNITEEVVMDSIHQFSNKITIIIVAHRISTVQKCDNIFVFENGRVSASGDYNELLNYNKFFSRMIQSEVVAPNRNITT